MRSDVRLDTIVIEKKYTDTVRRATEFLPKAHLWKGYPLFKVPVPDEGITVSFYRAIGPNGSFEWQLKDVTVEQLPGTEKKTRKRRKTEVKDEAHTDGEEDRG